MEHSLSMVDIVGDPSEEAVPHRNVRQCIVKVHNACSFEHGFDVDALILYTHAPGNIIVCNRNVVEYLRFRSRVELLKIEIPDSAFRLVQESTGTKSVDIRSSAHVDDNRIRSLISAVEEERREGFPSGSLYLDAIGQALASVLTQSHGVRPPYFRGGLAPLQLARVQDHVLSRLDEHITLKELANAVGLSPSYFSRVFRHSSGLTPQQFVMKARINLAKTLLRSSSAKIIDISVQCGFQTAQHFARVFRAACGASPTSYRREESLSLIGPDPAVATATKIAIAQELSNGSYAWGTSKLEAG